MNAYFKGNSDCSRVSAAPYAFPDPTVSLKV